MRRLTFIVLTAIGALSICQAQVSEMNWKLEYQIYMRMANDSNYTYDIRDAFLVTNTEEFSSEFVFYPASPGQDYIDNLKSGDESTQSNSTLWSALHGKIGGGWIHFTNCMAYALETGALKLNAPLMERPQTDWKPDPVTESYLHTKKWQYYAPYSQKNAIKEYKLRLKEGKLGDLKSMPKAYIDLFLNTNDKKYQRYFEDKEMDKLARIDLVKLVLGANYLGEAQINYISSSVLEAVKEYSSNKLPSVIIFEEFDAAAVMSLTADGYRIENVVYKAEANLSDEEASARTIQIKDIVDNINEYNSASFKKRLGNYYKD